MPIQAPQWTDYLNCPVCCREFGAPPRSPISLGCGHTLCRHCLKHLHRKQCPFDQAVIQVEPEELVVNTAILQLAGYVPPSQPYHPPSIQALPEHDRQAYDTIIKCMEHLAAYLKYCGNVVANTSIGGGRLSRPMHRKLVMLLQCAITDEEGRGRAARAARSLGERTVTELILQHQNPQQLSANLWAAVRARGCQFLGPAMQEEVLKLVLLALEDGSALSRKVLVMFVVQRLEPHFPQASKTSIGHVVQLLYRASCFKVSKRESDSSLMQLKEEFRTYESLRREHDAQIVQIATEAGLRIAPDQWSALLYGDTAHKSHMQSIIDKLQTPQSFAQSVQELFIALQRTGDPAQLIVMSLHLDRLASIDASPDAKSPTWQQLAEVITSLKEVVARLIHYLQQQATGRDANHNQKHSLPDRCLDPNANTGSPQTTASTPTHAKYKVSMCRDAATRSFCPRGSSCTFAHCEEELERFRMNMNGNYMYVPMAGGQPIPSGPPPGLATPNYAPYPMQQQQMIDGHNYPVPPMPPVNIPPEMGENHLNNGHQAMNYPPPQHRSVMLNQSLVGNDMMVTPGGERFYHFVEPQLIEELRAVPYRPDINPPRLAALMNNIQMYPRQQVTPQLPRENSFTPIMESQPEYRNANTYRDMHCIPRRDAVWAPNPGDMFNLNEMLGTLPPSLPMGAEAFSPGPPVLPRINRSCRTSPEEGAGPRAVGGPVSLPGPAPYPSNPGPSGPAAADKEPKVQQVLADRRAVGADRAVQRDRAQSSAGVSAAAKTFEPSGSVPATAKPFEPSSGLAAAAKAYELEGSDDEELEAGLQELERRIDTEFKNDD